MEVQAWKSKCSIDIVNDFIAYLLLDIGLMVLLSTVMLQRSVHMDTAEKLENEMMVTELCASLSPYCYKGKPDTPKYLQAYT